MNMVYSHVFLWWHACLQDVIMLLTLFQYPYRTVMAKGSRSWSKLRTTVQRTEGVQEAPRSRLTEALADFPIWVSQTVSHVFCSRTFGTQTLVLLCSVAGVNAYVPKHLGNCMVKQAGEHPVECCLIEALTEWLFSINNVLFQFISMSSGVVPV